MSAAASLQRAVALDAANKIRTKRAVEKKRVFKMSMREGRDVVAAWLEDPPEWLESERIGRLLCYPKSTGRAYSSRMLVHIANPHWPVAENTCVRQLTAPQRQRLANVLRGGWTPDA